MKAEKQRIYWVDTARALTMFFVVIGHIIPPGDIRTLMYSFHVPAFFFLAGLFANPADTFLKTVKKRFLSIMVPYYFFGLAAIAAYLLFGNMVTSGDLLSPQECLYGLMIGSVKTNCMKFNYHLWFLPALFVMNIFICPIKKLVHLINRSCNADIRLLMCIITFVSLIISCLMAVYTPFTYLPLGADTALRLFPFFAAGCTASEFKKFMAHTPASAKSKVLFGASAAALFTFTIIFAKLNEATVSTNFHVNYIRDYYGNTVFFWSAAICGTAAVVILSKLIPPVKPLTYTGQKTLAVLVMQKFPIMLFNSVIPFTVHLINSSNIFAIVTISAVTIMCCLAVNLIIEKYFPFVYGKSYIKKK